MFSFLTCTWKKALALLNEVLHRFFHEFFIIFFLTTQITWIPRTLGICYWQSHFYVLDAVELLNLAGWSLTRSLRIQVQGPSGSRFEGCAETYPFQIFTIFTFGKITSITSRNCSHGLGYCPRIGMFLNNDSVCSGKTAKPSDRSSGTVSLGRI